jgi:membrane associated rhomboid family serine protease
MFVFFPIRTSIRPYRTPYANYALILVNALVFLLSYWPHKDPVTGSPEILRQWAQQFMLTPDRPYIWQFVTYAFLHGSIMHIGGNMFFLYLFGRNVNDKLGNIGYVSFYLAGAVFSGIGHVLLGGGPVLGASGAIAAATGAYLVLFPQTLITVFYWLLYFIDTIEISALYFIGIKLIFWDNVIERSVPNVAYDAHLSGYGFGILTMFVMLGTGLISSSTFDLWSMLKHWNRRRQYRDVVAGGYDPFSGNVSKKISARQVDKKTQVTNKDEHGRIQQLRSEITQRIAQRNIPEAARKYLELIELDKEQLPPRQHLLDIANQLASENRHTEAVAAYEKFISHYGTYEHTEQVQLMLGILYSRYLHQTELAIKNLEAALAGLTDEGQVKMCRDELQKLQS